MLRVALLTSTEKLEFFHNYANGPDGSMMSAILLLIFTHFRVLVCRPTQTDTGSKSVLTPPPTPFHIITPFFPFSCYKRPLHCKMCLLLLVGEDLTDLAKYNGVARQQKGRVDVFVHTCALY